ncbi:hypothetical protein PM082_017364 [Marasmius tenuissimus]|nr:hypothetical protein PM082_017364 [Marasmius tenuissimus]
MHRADLYNLLHEIASPLIDLRLGVEVASIDTLKPSVTLKSGETISGDIIIGADGVHSVVRSVLGNPQVPKPVGCQAFRYLIPAEDMLEDPELRPLVEKPVIYTWSGPHKHVVGYSIRGGSLLNVVAYVKDAYVPDTSTGDADAMREAYAKEPWDPRVRKILALAKPEHLVRWTLLHSEPLDRWVHREGPVTLLGDAAHTFSPHYGQGANLALEDAGVLGNLLSRITDRQQLRTLLNAYEEIRRPRRTATWKDTMAGTARAQLPDGEEQRARDASRPQPFKNRKAHELTIPIDCSHDFGYDADAVVDTWWSRNGSSVLRLGQRGHFSL